MRLISISTEIVFIKDIFWEKRRHRDPDLDIDDSRQKFLMMIFQEGTNKAGDVWVA